RLLIGVLAGALAASALWGGGLYAYAARQDKPDIGGYQVTDNLCAQVGMKGLSAYFDRGDDWDSTVGRNDAVDVADCRGELFAKSDVAPVGNLSVSVKLHRAVEYRTEFDAAADTMVERIPKSQGEARLKWVEGIGDRAFVLTLDGTDGTEYKTLYVLDGSAEFSLWVNVTRGADHGGLDKPMIQDLRAVMKKLGG
ncbi:hypothetical protein P8605_33255, partial [Streptomyces sp. T-3]|nr:hypothetical protein [Streptomyces sp. T-3]